jgi:hypothetical protein
VNAYALLAVNEHLEYLRAESARRERYYSKRGPSLRDRIASATNGLRRSLGGESSTTFLPALQDYPYRG